MLFVMALQYLGPEIRAEFSDFGGLCCGPRADSDSESPAAQRGSKPKAGSCKCYGLQVAVTGPVRQTEHYR